MNTRVVWSRAYYRACGLSQATRRHLFVYRCMCSMVHVRRMCI